MNIDQTLDQAAHFQRNSRLREAELLYRNVLAQDPNHPRALQLLGSLAFQVGQIPVACDLFARSAAVDPGNAGAHSDWAFTLTMLKRFDEAIVAAGKAIAIDPNLHEAHNSLGIALREKDQLDQAVAEFREAIRLKPDYFKAHSNLAYVFEIQRQFDEAAEEYRAAIRLNPDFFGAYNNLGNILKEQGDIPAAVECYQKAFSLEPRFLPAYDNYLYLLYYHPNFTAEQIREEHIRWEERYAAPLRQSIPPHTNDRNPDRKLRIGYVSPDFFSHCQSLYTIPLLANRDKQNFEITCYSSVKKPDALTSQIQSLSDRWRNILGLSDDQAAEMIRQDQIDILVDLTLHMADNRLMIFARKPAPVQVTWLGYPGTTGLNTMDYRLTDPQLDPVGTDALYVEKSIRLPDSFWCYDPLTDKPEVNELPATGNGYITFGCLNNFCKVTDQTLRAWSQILMAVPNSKMIILAAPGSHRQRLLNRMSELLIDPGRIEFVAKRPRQQYLELYRRIDISLDTFPVNGHTTSLDSLWMGVPVVTLTGNTAISRAGFCQLSLLGLPELIGNSEGDYVRIAAYLTWDLSRLSEMRKSLRPRIQQSALMDAPRFVRNIETIYRAVWRAWCNGEVYRGTP